MYYLLTPARRSLAGRPTNSPTLRAPKARGTCWSKNSRGEPTFKPINVQDYKNIPQLRTGDTVDSGSRTHGSSVPCKVRGRDVRNHLSLRHSPSLQASRPVIITTSASARSWILTRNPSNSEFRPRRHNHWHDPHVACHQSQVSLSIALLDTVNLR